MKLQKKIKYILLFSLLLMSCVKKIVVNECDHSRDVSVKEAKDELDKLKKYEDQKRAEYKKYIDDIEKIKDDKERLDRLSDAFNDDLEITYIGAMEQWARGDTIIRDPRRKEIVEYYIVVPGDVLWRIGLKYLDDIDAYKLVYQWNSEQIENPDMIFPGQILRIIR